MFNWAFKKVIKLREKVAVDLGDSDVEKPFLDHLEDLRTMIVRMTVTLLSVTILTFFFCEELLAIIKHPLVMAGIADKITLQNFKPVGGFMTAMNISLVAGIVLAFPLLLYFLLDFVLPGLRSSEKKVVFPALGVGAGLFLLGVVFAYYMVAPRALWFFYDFSIKFNNAGDAIGPATAGPTGSAEQKFANEFGIVWEARAPGFQHIVETSADGGAWTKVADISAKPGDAKDGAGGIRFVRITCVPPSGTGSAAAAIGAPAALAVAKPFIWELTEYVKFVCQFVLIFGACFELPVVVMAMVKLDVLSYKVMKGSRSWAAIAIAIVAAVITPTQDAFTLGLLAAPMYVLYEICIWLAWWMEKKDRALYPEYYKDQDADEKALEVTDDWDNENYNPWSSSDEEEEPSAKPAPPVSDKPAEQEPTVQDEPAPDAPTPEDAPEGKLTAHPPEAQPGVDERNQD